MKKMITNGLAALGVIFVVVPFTVGFVYGMVEPCLKK